jgi:hypothetical protein
MLDQIVASFGMHASLAQLIYKHRKDWVCIVSVPVLSCDLLLYIVQFSQFIICQNSSGSAFVSLKEFEEYLGGVLLNVQGPAEKPDDF